MTLRVGTDIVVVARIEHHIATIGEPFLARTWTSSERADCAGRAESLAARWAAKEAVLKALGLGVAEVRLTEVEIVGGPAGPHVRLHGAAAARAAELGVRQWALSLSHDGGMALAFVVAM